jgi:ATP-dependent Zn protease
VDSAVRKLLLQAEALAEKVIIDHSAGLKALIKLLEEKETLHREQIEQCLGKRPPRLSEVKGSGGLHGQ